MQARLASDSVTRRPTLRRERGTPIFDCVERGAQAVGELQHLGGQHLRQFLDRFFPRLPVAIILVNHLRRHAVEIEQIVLQAVDPGADLVNGLDSVVSGSRN